MLPQNLTCAKRKECEMKIVWINQKDVFNAIDHKDFMVSEGRRRDTLLLEVATGHVTLKALGLGQAFIL